MKKKLAMLFATGMTLALTMGCNVFGAETTEEYRNHGEKIEGVDKSKEQFDMAKVTEINGDTLVVKLAEKPDIPEGERGERPERPPMAEGEEGERPERPPMSEGEEGEKPERPPMLEGEEGENPRRGNKLMKEMNFSEQEMEITLDENIEIHIGGEEQGNAEDIETDDVIKICYAEDGETIESIFIRK